MIRLSYEEYLRDLSLDFLRLKREGIDLYKYFEKSEEVIIYGAGPIGRYIGNELGRYVNVLCYIDRTYAGESYEGIPIYDRESTRIRQILTCFNGRIIVTPMYSFDSIETWIDDMGFGSRIVPVDRMIAELEFSVCKDSFDDRASNEIMNLILGRKTVIEGIVMTGTIYTLVSCLLLFDGWEKTLFILQGNPLLETRDAMRKYGLMAVLYDDNSESNDNPALLHIVKMIGKEAKRRGIKTYGHDHLFCSRYFYGSDYSLVEDGVLNYVPESGKREKIAVEESGNSITRKRFYYPYGFDDSVKLLFLTGMCEIPIEFRDKRIVKYELKSLWDSKENDEKSMIEEFCCLSPAVIENELSNNESIIFLTQPIYKNAISDYSIQQQIELYKKVLSGYDLDKIIIKAHPRDDIDYKSVFPGVNILPRQFPMELLSMLDIKVCRMIIIDPAEVTGVSPNLLVQKKKFGYEFDVFNIRAERID